MGRGVWGIDVSKFSIKAVRVEKGASGYTLTHARVAPFSGAGSGEEANSDEHIKTTLQQLKSELRIGGERVVISLPSQSTFNRLIKLPPVDDDRIPETVRHEAQQQIPFNINEVIWDYQYVDRTYAPGEEKEVILFAIKKDVVEQFLSNIAELNLNIEAIQFGPVALFNFLALDQEIGGSTLAIDMGGANTYLIVLDGAKFWVRNLSITGNGITKELQKAFNIPFAEAEKLKLKAAQSQQAQKIFAAVQPVLRDLVSEVQRSIGYYKSISKASKFDKIILLGNSTRTLNLQKFVSQSLQMPTERISKLKTIAVGGSVDQGQFNEDLTTVCTALGLALQAFGETINKVNLLPDAYKRRKEVRKKQPYVAGAVAAMLALVVVMGVDASGKASTLAAESAAGQGTLDRLNESRRSFQETVDKAGQVKSLKAAVCSPVDPDSGPLDRLASISTERDLVLRVMDKVLPAVPKNGDRALADSDRLWILDWRFKEVPAVVATGKTDPYSGSSTPKRVVTLDRKLIVTLEGAITKRDNAAQAEDFIVRTLLGCEPGTGKLAPGRSTSVVDAFKLKRNTQKDLTWAVEVLAPTTVLKPAWSLSDADKELEKDTEAKPFVRFSVTLGIPVGEDNRKAAQLLDEADEIAATNRKDDARAKYAELLREYPHTWVVRNQLVRVNEGAK